MAFKVGQKVVCVIKREWIVLSGKDKGRIGYGPKKNEVVKIFSIRKTDGYLSFEEYGSKEHFDFIFFRPLDYDFVEEVIKQVTPKEVEV